MFFSVVMLKCWVLLFGNILFFEFPETVLLKCLNECVGFCYNFVCFLVFLFSIFDYLDEEY